MSSQLLLSHFHVRLDEFENEYDLVNGQVLVTQPRNLTTSKDF